MVWLAIIIAEPDELRAGLESDRLFRFVQRQLEISWRVGAGQWGNVQIMETGRRSLGRTLG